ncbi:MAG: hypothetical protein ACREBS_10900 [Nitrososphaerales archaeon]
MTDKRRDPVQMLAVIFAAIWLLVLIGTIIVFRYIVPIMIFHSFLDSILKGVLATMLVVIWLALFVALRNAMVRRQLLPAKEKSSSS